MKRLFTFAVSLLAIAGTVAIGVGLWFMSGGINSKQQPSAAETTVARQLRAMAIPTSARKAANPIVINADALQEGMAHFADHCASCHANDGSGDTEMGRGLYPKVPDMRQAATQSMTDGELFYIIENGVRLTGMPAWGTGTKEGADASWTLVHFIRHLPKITDGEVEQMKAMNPKSPDEWREEEEARRFLEGGDEPAKTPPAASHKHGG